MKNKSFTFAASTPNSLYRHNIAVAIFMTVCLLSAKDKRLSIRNGLLHLCCDLSLATWRGDSLSFLYTLVFLYMPNSKKNYIGVKYSSARVTPDSAKTVSFKEFQTEKNAKNSAYYFILTIGLYDQFNDFLKNYHSDDPHADVVGYFLSKI
jgi:hypothetical protein